MALSSLAAFIARTKGGSLRPLFASPSDAPRGPLAEGSTVIWDLPYVTDGHYHQKLDIHYPPGWSGELLPVVIHIHPGRFQYGLKEGTETDKVEMAYYLQCGFAVASPNYRLVPDFVFPSQIQDIKAAIRWLRANAAEYSLDPNRFAAFGQSCGGYMASMMGTSPHIKEFDVGDHLDVSSAVQAVINYSGATDFTLLDTQRLEDGYLHNIDDSPEAMFIGGPLLQHPAAVEMANPIKYITADAPPFFIAHGDADLIVAGAQSQLLVDALRAVGVPVTFYNLPGYNHPPYIPRVLALVELTGKFLKEYL